MAFKNKESEIKKTELPPIQPKPIIYSQPKIVPNHIEPTMPTATKELSLQHEQKDEEPFFVRIDKFNSSKENFFSIGKKVKELDNIFNTLERIKKQEDRELNEWKDEASSIKELLSQIDKEIFGKL